jgi:hypothetical protein
MINHFALRPVLFLFDPVIEVRLVFADNLSFITTALVYLVKRHLLQLLILNEDPLMICRSLRTVLSHDLINVRLMVVRAHNAALRWLSSLLRLRGRKRGFLLFFFEGLFVFVESLYCVKLRMCLEIQK